ncbi:MAG: hypothetical protein HYS12_25775 [Planctomycetes bacterium]|nr:hypothetical protein [Planctomycetota bacterium]
MLDAVFSPHATEIGHLLGQEHEANGLMAETLAAGTLRDPSSGFDLLDVAALDRVFADSRTSLAAPFLDGSVPQALLNPEEQREGKAKA